jgi:hypothetical protein
MIIIKNFITLCKYLINNNIGSIEFEYIDEDKDDREICYCNLCYTFRNIILFITRRLK